MKMCTLRSNPCYMRANFHSIDTEFACYLSVCDAPVSKPRRTQIVAIRRKYKLNTTLYHVEISSNKMNAYANFAFVRYIV
jgi:hypothetical protein